MAYTTKYNLKPVKSGNTFKGVAFEFFSEETEEPIFLENHSIKLQVRKNHNAPIVELEKIYKAGGGILVDNNKVLIEPFKANIPPGSYVYDIKLISPDGEEVKNNPEGTWEILPIVTR